MTKEQLLLRLARPERREYLEARVIAEGVSAGVKLARAVKSLTDAELEFVAQRISDLKIIGKLNEALS